MANTLGDMLDRIADETRYSGSTERTIFQTCINDAIAHYEVERFWWNESRSVTFNTVASQEYYTSSDSASIPYVLKFDAVTITRSSTDKSTLVKQDWTTLEEWNADGDSTGIPSDYAYFNQSIRLYPVPDAVYAVRIAGLFKLTALSGDSDSNAWTTLGEGEELIRSRAKAIFYSQYTRDDQNANRALQMAESAYLRLKTSTHNRVGASRIRPYL